jgi:hypothetical protein
VSVTVEIRQWLGEGNFRTRSVSFRKRCAASSGFVIRSSLPSRTDQNPDPTVQLLVGPPWSRAHLLYVHSLQKCRWTTIINCSARSSLDGASLIQASPTTARYSLHPTDPITARQHALSRATVSRDAGAPIGPASALKFYSQAASTYTAPAWIERGSRRASRKTANSPGVEFALPGRHLTQSKPIRSRSPFGYMTQLTPGGNFDASPSQSSPTERTRPVACSPWRKLLVYSVCGTLLARLGRDCSRGSTTMFSSFADLAFPKQNCSLPKSRCVPRTWRDTATDWTAGATPGSPDPTGRLFAEASIKNACFHKHLVSRI